MDVAAAGPSCICEMVAQVGRVSTAASVLAKVPPPRYNVAIAFLCHRVFSSSGQAPCFLVSFMATTFPLQKRPGHSPLWDLGPWHPPKAPTETPRLLLSILQSRHSRPDMTLLVPWGLRNNRYLWPSEIGMPGSQWYQHHPGFRRGFPFKGMHRQRTPDWSPDTPQCHLVLLNLPSLWGGGSSSSPSTSCRNGPHSSACSRL